MKPNYKLLTITTGRWVRTGDQLAYEYLGKDVLGNKYTFSVVSTERAFQKGIPRKEIVSEGEWNRMQRILKDQIDKKYAEILEALKEAHEKRQKSQLKIKVE
jgi:hypothetical protein